MGLREIVLMFLPWMFLLVSCTAGGIIVELKAVKLFEDIHYATLKSYMEKTTIRVGLLLNFNAPTLVIKRVVL